MACMDPSWMMRIAKKPANDVRIDVPSRNMPVKLDGPLCSSLSELFSTSSHALAPDADGGLVCFDEVDWDTLPDRLRHPFRIPVGQPDTAVRFRLADT